MITELTGLINHIKAHKGTKPEIDKFRFFHLIPEQKNKQVITIIRYRRKIPCQYTPRYEGTT